MLSLTKILNEMTARVGPRTGGFEIDKQVVMDAVKKIYQEIWYQRITGEQKDTKFYLSINNPATGEPEVYKVILTLSTGKGTSEGEWEPRENTIKLFILGSGWKFADANKENQIRRIYSLLMHELTHKVDIKTQNSLRNWRLYQFRKDNPEVKTHPKTGKKLPRLKTLKKKKYIESDEDFSGYINQPAEVAAMLQQVIEEIQAGIPGMKDELYRRDPRAYKFRLSFLKQQPEILFTLSPTWKEYNHMFTPQNERKFLQAVARLSKLI